MLKYVKMKNVLPEDFQFYSNLCKYSTRSLGHQLRRCKYYLLIMWRCPDGAKKQKVAVELGCEQQIVKLKRALGLHLTLARPWGLTPKAF